MNIGKEYHTEPANMRFLSNGERVPFRCRLCGKCCMHAEDSIMLEPPDIFRLTRFLKTHDDSIVGPEDVLDRYAHPVVIGEGFPVFVLNTAGTEQSCTFLKEDRCAVYAARPRVCRLYPFGVGPGSRSRDFKYYLCTEQTHHFGSGSVKAGDWISANFPKEEREYLKADYDLLVTIGRAVRNMGEERFRKHLFQFLYYRYYNYDPQQPFLSQYRKNTEALKDLLAGVSVGGKV